MAPSGKGNLVRRLDPDESMLRLGIIGLFLLIASFVLDKTVMEFFSLIQNPVFDFFMQWFTHGGTLFVIMFAMISLFLWDEGKKKAVLPLWLSFATSLVGTFLLKFIIQRPRPVFEMVIPLISYMDYSFPSSHTAIAFCAVPLIRKAFPSVSWFFIIFASIVGLSRIYIQAHYLSDVVAGAIFGLFIGFIVLKVWQSKVKGVKV